MKKDTFFSQEHCDRCGDNLRVRIMSWFNDETICMECSNKELVIKRKLMESGDKNNYEGCGYIPKVN